MMKVANLLAAISIALPIHVGAIETKQPVTYAGLKWAVTGGTNYQLCERMSGLQLDLTGPGDGAVFSASGYATCKGGALIANGTAVLMRNETERYLSISIFLADSRISCQLNFDTLSSDTCRLYNLATNEIITMLSLTFSP